MSKTNRRVTADALTTIAACSMLLLMPSTTASAAELPQRDTLVHTGVATCATSQCHGSAVVLDGSNVQQNEYVTWTRSDPHSRAWTTLTSEESRSIAMRLGLDSAQTADLCLDCHADNVPVARRGERFQISDGVGCEACHGGAERWLSTHDDAATADHAANVASGMYPAAEPEARAELCLSCHLGTEDKFATHRIMAAGHPRLAFELDTFTELWRNAGSNPHYLVDADYRDRKTVHSHTFTWAKGVVLESMRRMQLLDSPLFEPAALFPELGLYDCHACHQTMKTADRRRLPRHGHAEPGLPFINDGSLVMVLALARAIGDPGVAALESVLAELHVSSAKDAAATRTAANRVVNLLRDLDRRMDPDRVDASRQALLAEILALGADGNYPDYISAEQAFMAVQLLAYESGNRALIDELGPLGDALLDDERYRPARFAALLAALEKE